MVDLKWIDGWSIGVDQIDNDHRNLLRIMQETKAAIEEEDYGRCAVLLSDLIKAAKDHFSREESLLSDLGYPGLERHIKYHKELLLKAKSVEAICKGIKERRNLEECFEGMAEFLIDDVVKGDLHFKSFLEDAGITKVSKSASQGTLTDGPEKTR